VSDDDVLVISEYSLGLRHRLLFTLSAAIAKIYNQCQQLWDTKNSQMLSWLAYALMTQIVQ